jgi:hypothetical protein
MLRVSLVGGWWPVQARRWLERGCYRASRLTPAPSRRLALKSLFEDSLRGGAFQQGIAVVAREGDEMRVSGFVITPESPGHGRTVAKRVMAPHQENPRSSQRLA